MIKAIQTRYKGYKFRSRLEARWAVFFDHMGIDWLYEHEGYHIADTMYLPDFWLPTFNGGCFAEVKSSAFTKQERRLAEALSLQSGYNFWLCVGVPDFRVYEILGVVEEHIDGRLVQRIGSHVGIPNADQACGEDRMYVYPGYENEDGTIPQEYINTCSMEDLQFAVQAARSARFEHGENPK